MSAQVALGGRTASQSPINCSYAAAKRATELGLTAYNVLGGFEGDPDAHGQRGHQNGWRHAGLPWRQN